MENFPSFTPGGASNLIRTSGIQPGEYYVCGRRPLVRVLARPSFTALWASAREISVRGIRLVVDNPFEPGTVLAIQLQRKLSGLSGILTAQVRQLIPGESVGEAGRWLLDCSLSRSLTDDEVYTLLDGEATEPIVR